MEKRKEVIWLVNPYCMPPKFEPRIQTIKRAEYLNKCGYQAIIVSSNLLHNSKQTIYSSKRWLFKAKYEGIDFIHICTLSYQMSFIRRLLSHIIFYLKLILFWHKIDKPDHVVFTAVVPFNLPALMYARFKRIKVTLDVVDLWPESFVAYGIISHKSILLPFLYRLEALTYNLSPTIVHTMSGFNEYVSRRNSFMNFFKIDTTKKIVEIPNGVDLTDFDRNLKKFDAVPIENLLETTKIVLYIGSIRRANGLHSLIEAFGHLETVDCVLHIYGDGDEREELMKFIEENNINNVEFKDKWIPLERVPSLLNRADVNILNYANDGVLKYGGSQSKSYQYYAAGKPICSNVESYNDMINRYSIGISKTFHDSKEYADAILKLLTLSASELEVIQENSRNLARNFDYSLLTNTFINKCLLED